MALVPKRKPATVADIIKPVHDARVKASKDLEIFASKRSTDAAALADRAAEMSRLASAAQREAAEAEAARNSL